MEINHFKALLRILIYIALLNILFYALKFFVSNLIEVQKAELVELQHCLDGIKKLNNLSNDYFLNMNQHYMFKYTPSIHNQNFSITKQLNVYNLSESHSDFIDHNS